jgi:hypothetical protein
MLIFAHYINESGKELAHLFPSWEAYNRATFSPDFLPLSVIPLSISGKTYKEKKEDARRIAAEIQANECGGLSWAECADLSAFFERLAHRFGLRAEYAENGIL